MICVDKKLYVGNLPWSIDDAALQALFESYGEVISANVIRFKQSGKSKGFGFVEFAKLEDAQKAMAEMHQKEVEGRRLVVNIANPPRESTDEQTPAASEEPMPESVSAAEEMTVVEEAPAEEQVVVEEPAVEEEEKKKKKKE